MHRIEFASHRTLPSLTSRRSNRRLAYTRAEIDSQCMRDFRCRHADRNERENTGIVRHARVLYVRIEHHSDKQGLLIEMVEQFVHVFVGASRILVTVHE